MTTFQLEVSVNQQNLMRLEPEGGINSKDFCYFFKLRCYVCDETSKEVTLHVDDKPMQYKCKVCKNVGKIKVLPNYGQPLTFQRDQSSTPFVPLVRFIANEFEPVEYCFNGGWTGTAINGETVDMNLLNPPCERKVGELNVMVNNPTYRFTIIRD